MEPPSSPGQAAVLTAAGGREGGAGAQQHASLSPSGPAAPAPSSPQPEHAAAGLPTDDGMPPQAPAHVYLVLARRRWVKNHGQERVLRRGGGGKGLFSFGCVLARSSWEQVGQAGQHKCRPHCFCA